VANGLLYNMMLNGMSESEARKNFWVVDDKGLIGQNRRTYFANQIPWRRDDYEDCLSLERIVDQVKPTILLGLTGVGGLFSENVIRKMGKYCERPIIFPLSNPTSKAECTAENAYKWTDGRCVFASGSPFKPVEYNGKTYTPAQSNNMYTYPGLGLGALVSQSKMITDSMLNRCAIALMNCVTEDDYNEGRIFPRVRQIPKLTKIIALNIALQSQIDGVSKMNKQTEDEFINLINSRFWKPSYGSLVRIDQNRY
jgi:malic enzyme